MVLVPYVPRRPESAHTPVPGRTVKGARRNRRSRPCTTKAGTPVARRGSGCRSRCSRCAASSTQGAIWPAGATCAPSPRGFGLQLLASLRSPVSPVLLLLATSYHYHTALVGRRHGTGRGIDRFCNVPYLLQERKRGARGALNAKPPVRARFGCWRPLGLPFSGTDGWMDDWAFGSVPVPASRFRSRLALHFHLPLRPPLFMFSRAVRLSPPGHCTCRERGR